MNSPLINISSNVKDIVISDYRTSDVFKRYGISYCCDGNITIMEACLQNDLDTNEVINALQNSKRRIQISNDLQFKDWKTGFLIDYIVNVHHAYLKLVLPSLVTEFSTLAQVHKDQFQELEYALELFNELAVSKLAHTRHEEEIIFPYIKQIENAFSRKETYGNLFVRTLRKPLHHINSEHEKIKELVLALRKIQGEYVLSSQTCAGYRVVNSKLNELEEDLEQHTYLENDILFPRAIEMERELLQL